MALTAIGLLACGLVVYLMLTVGMVGWYKHDNTITVTEPNGHVTKYRLEK